MRAARPQTPRKGTIPLTLVLNGNWGVFHTNEQGRYATNAYLPLFYALFVFHDKRVHGRLV